MCGCDAGVLQKRGLILARFVFVVYSVVGILRCVPRLSVWRGVSHNEWIVGEIQCNSPLEKLGKYDRGDFDKEVIIWTANGASNK